MITPLNVNSPDFLWDVWAQFEKLSLDSECNSKCTAGLYLQAGLYCSLLSPDICLIRNDTDLVTRLTLSLCFFQHVLWYVMLPHPLIMCLLSKPPLLRSWNLAHWKAVFLCGRNLCGFLLSQIISPALPSGHGNLFETDPPYSFLSFTLCPPGFCPSLALNLLSSPASLSLLSSLSVLFLLLL